MATSERGGTGDYGLTSREMALLWERGILSWMLWPQQLPIYLAIQDLPDSVVLAVVLCARQFGKTFLGALMAAEDCLRFPNSSILVVGPTLKQTREIVAPKVRQIMMTAPKGLIRPSKSEGKWYIGDSDFIIGGFDQKSSDRGKSLKNIYIEEVVDSHPDQYLESWRSDLSPALTHSQGGKMKVLTTLPKIPDHPFITETIPEAKLSGAFYSYTIDDNIKLSKAQYDRCVKLAGGRDSIDFRREYLNEIVRDASIVIIPVFDRKRHVGEATLPTTAFWQTTIDWGGVRDKTCAILHYYDFLTNVDLFVDERVFEANTPTQEIRGEVERMERSWGLSLLNSENVPYFGHMLLQRAVDCPGQIMVDLNEMHFKCIVPNKADWLANINVLAAKFADDRILINPRCKFLIESAQSGMFNKTKTDFERTRALGHCDGIAAMMYAIRTRCTDSPYGHSPMFQRAQNAILPPNSQGEQSSVQKLFSALTAVKRRR